MEKEHLIKLLVEAHSNELALVNTLEAHARIAEAPGYKSLIRDHIRETKQHASRLERRLEQLGYQRSLFATAYELAQNVVKQSLVLAKGPMDALRGGGDAREKMVKNAIDEAMTEGLEIASYDTIESVARSMGDHETAEIAAEIRLDEERMFESLRKEIPVLADIFVRSDGAAGGAAELDAPWDGYDDMTVDEITERLDGASDALVLSVRRYEQKNKNRSTVLEATKKESINA